MKWFTEFRCGRTSTIDVERSGRPVEVAIPETIAKIRNMVLADRRLKVWEIVEAIGISHGSVVSLIMLSEMFTSIPKLNFKLVKYRLFRF